MPITTRQIADCTQTDPAVFSRLIRTGMLKGMTLPNGKHAVTKEDLADFFVAHPEYWRRFLSTRSPVRYHIFRTMIEQEVKQRTEQESMVRCITDQLIWPRYLAYLGSQLQN